MWKFKMFIFPLKFCKKAKIQYMSKNILLEIVILGIN